MIGLEIKSLTAPFLICFDIIVYLLLTQTQFSGHSPLYFTLAGYYLKPLLKIEDHE